MFQMAAGFNIVDMEAYATFRKYDTDNDGYLTPENLYHGLKDLSLDLAPDVFKQYIDSCFLYADLDQDGRLSFKEYRSMHEKQRQARM